MSPSRAARAAAPAVRQASLRVALDLGSRILDERRRRSWPLSILAQRAGLSVSAVHAIESGRVGSLDSYVRVALALGLRPRFDIEDPRQRRTAGSRAEDPVHAAMGEVVAAHLRRSGYDVALDEPYQHYQFAGRADLVAWTSDRTHLLHLENRTRLPNIQEVAGSFAAKRVYLAPVIAQRLGLDRPFVVASHVIVALWSAEVLHILRIRAATFASLCPHGGRPFDAWWRGNPPDRSTTGLVLFDPIERIRGRRWVGLESVDRVRPRYRDYADALDALRGARLA